MSKRELSAEEKRLHKRLILGNFIICVIALIAGISMLFMPWLDLRIHIEGAKLADVISEMNSSTASVGAKPFDASVEEASQNAIMNALSESLKDEDFDIPINLYPMKMLGAAMGGKTEIEELFNSAIGKNGAAEFLDEFINDLVPVVIKASLNTTIDQMFNNLDGGELSEEERQIIEKYKAQVNDTLDAIAENPTKENAKAQLNGLVDDLIGESSSELAPEDVQQMRDMIDEIVEQGANEEGNFDYVYLIKNIDMDALEGIVNGSSPADPDASPASSSANGSAVAYAVAYEGEGEGSASTTNNPLTEIIEMLEDPGSLVAESLDDQTVELLNTAFLGIFAVYIGFPVFLCAILALSAFIRMFTEKKRVRYWYVKLILFFSTLMIVSLNLSARYLLPSLNLGATAGTVLGAFSISFLGSGVVLAICWVALTILSLVYYGPTKRKIKRLSAQ